MPPKNKPEYNVWGEPVVPWEEYTHISTSKKKEDPGEDWMDDYYFLAQGTEMDDIRGNMDAASRSEMLYSKKDGKGIPNPLRASGLIPLVPTSGTDLIAETALTGLAEAYRENPAIGVVAGLAYGKAHGKYAPKIKNKLDKVVGDVITEEMYSKAFRNLKDDPMLGDIDWKKYSELVDSEEADFMGKYSTSKGRYLKKAMGLEKEYKELTTGDGSLSFLDEGTPKDYSWRLKQGIKANTESPEEAIGMYDEHHRKRKGAVSWEDWKHPTHQRPITDSEVEEYAKGSFSFASYPFSWYKDTAKTYALQGLKSKKGSKKKLRLGRFLSGEWAENTARHEGRHFFQHVEGTDIANRNIALGLEAPNQSSRYPREFSNRASRQGTQVEGMMYNSWNTMNKPKYETDFQINMAFPENARIPKYAFHDEGWLLNKTELKKLGISDKKIDIYQQGMADRRYYRRPIEIDARLEEILHSGEDIKAFKNLKKMHYSKDEIRDWVKHYEKGREKIYGTTKKR